GTRVKAVGIPWRFDACLPQVLRALAQGLPVAFADTQGCRCASNFNPITSPLEEPSMTNAAPKSSPSSPWWRHGVILLSADGPRVDRLQLRRRMLLLLLED
ncbi:MAG: hypothetical protein WCG85_06745, partial [Polyangia bacterium]